MTCKIIKTESGTAIMCIRGRSKPRCDSCGRPAPLLCDFELYGEKAGKTCDRKICFSCTDHVDGKDYCPPHAKIMKHRAEIK